MCDNIAANLSEIKQRVAEAAVRSGRDADAVELLVVSKTWPAENVAEVVAAGHLGFGENKVQDNTVRTFFIPKNTTEYI